MTFPVTGAGILVFDHRDKNYWLALEKSGSIGIPGGKREKNESIQDCALRETHEETLDAIRSRKTFTKILKYSNPKKVRQVQLNETSRSNGQKWAFVTYIIRTKLKPNHDPVKTFGKRRAKKGLSKKNKELQKLIPVSRSVLVQALQSKSPSIQGYPLRFCAVRSLKLALSQNKL